MSNVTRAVRHDILDQVWQEIKAYRALPMLIWDARDHGNFHGTYFEQNRDALRASDPNGLCEALLLDAMLLSMLQATHVTLASILLSEQTLPALRTILHTRSVLLDVMGEDMTVFRQRVSALLKHLKPTHEAPSNTHMAICLRDAIHSLDHGLAWSWLEFSTEAAQPPLRLSDTVLQFNSMSDMIDMLAGDMLHGVYLCRVKKIILIAIKHPGRVGYLSCTRISEHTGDYENTGLYTQMKAFSFDSPTHRFPSEGDFIRDKQTPAANNVPACVWGSLHDLPATTVMWLALLVEILDQRFDTLFASPSDLIEVAKRALPGATVDPTSLPALRQPRFALSPLSLEDGMESLSFTAWEKRFLSPLLASLDADFFLPIGRGKHTIKIPADLSNTSYSEIEFTMFNPDVVGSAARLDEVRRTVFLNNLALYSLTLGNLQLEKNWREIRESWRDKVVKRAKKGRIPAFAVLIRDSERDLFAIPAYVQNPKRVTYAPLCLFDGKTPATHHLLLKPKNDHDVADMLGCNIADLPDWLQGWQRDTGTWTCHDRVQPDCPENVQTHVRRWHFARSMTLSVLIATTEMTAQRYLTHTQRA